MTNDKINRALIIALIVIGIAGLWVFFAPTYNGDKDFINLGIGVITLIGVVSIFLSTTHSNVEVDDDYEYFGTSVPKETPKIQEITSNEVKTTIKKVSARDSHYALHKSCSVCNGCLACCQQKGTVHKYAQCKGDSFIPKRKAVHIKGCSNL